MTLTLLALLSLPAAVAEGKEEAPPAKPIAYKAPKGWQEEKAGQFVTARFRVGHGEDAVAVTVTALAGQGGGIAANVNRWRGQAGLKSLEDDEAKKAVRPAKVDGVAGHTFDASGEKVRVVVTFVKVGDSTWYFRMSGPVARVKEQAPAFTEFLKSVRFKEQEK